MKGGAHQTDDAKDADDAKGAPKKKNVKWGRTVKKDPGRLDLTGFKPKDTTPVDMFDFGKDFKGASYMLDSQSLQNLEDDYYDMMDYGIPEDKARQIARYFGRKTAKERAGMGTDAEKDMFGSYVSLPLKYPNMDIDDEAESELGPLSEPLRDYLKAKLGI